MRHSLTSIAIPFHSTNTDPFKEVWHLRDEPEAVIHSDARCNSRHPAWMALIFAEYQSRHPGRSSHSSPLSWASRS